MGQEQNTRAVVKRFYSSLAIDTHYPKKKEKNKQKSAELESFQKQWSQWRPLSLRSKKKVFVSNNFRANSTLLLYRRILILSRNLKILSETDVAKHLKWHVKNET